MIRLLHTADWQIGRSYRQFDADDAAALAEARFDVVVRIAAHATAVKADAVLVAGDVFDAQGLSDKTLRRLGQALQGFGGLWLLLPGNHDAALARSVWTQVASLGALPPNARPCLDATPVELPAGCVVLPAPLVQRHTVHDLTAWFDGAATRDGWPRIGLAHGAVQGVLPDEVDAHNPIAPDRAARAGLDWLALGDWHGAKRIDDRTWYAGTPETDRFKDNESGHVLEVELDGPGAVPRVKPARIGRYRWQSVEAQLALPSDVDRLAERLAAFGVDDVLDVTVAGEGDLMARQRIERALEETAARVRAMVSSLDGLRVQPTAAELDDLRADGYVGEVLAALRDRQATEGAGTAQDALLLLAGVLSERARRAGDGR